MQSRSGSRYGPALPGIDRLIALRIARLGRPVDIRRQRDLSVNLEKRLEIRIEGEDGPQAVPDNTLVQVVGCLTKLDTGGWLVINASEPVRTSLWPSRCSIAVVISEVALPP